MIEALSGTVSNITQNRVTLAVSGVSFALFVPQARTMAPGSQTLFVHMNWNSEQGPTLYGFKTAIERTLFLLITECSKIGPRIALTILDQMAAEEFVETVASQNEKRLSALNGIGAKKAETIIVQLKERIAKLIASGAITKNSKSQFSQWQTLHDALTSLGYTKQEITKTLSALTKDGSSDSSFEILMRKALGLLSSKTS